MDPGEKLNRALDRFYRRYRQQLFTHALALTRCPERAEDAIQDAFYGLYRVGHLPRNLRAYVFRAVRNAAINQIRRNPPAAVEFDDYIFDGRMDPGEAVVKHEFAKEVARALGAISEDERETIVQHLYADLTFREISELRDAPLGTVAAWYRRGLEKLRQLLEEQP